MKNLYPEIAPKSEPGMMNNIVAKYTAYYHNAGGKE
jgi:hypothetical protein